MRLRGFRFFFFSNEVNEPPHIHVESNDKYAKFWLEPLTLELAQGLKTQELLRAERLIAENINMIRGKWNEVHGG